MAICHVAVTGRDRRHLTALGPNLRIVVVGYREEKAGIVVDAYVRSEKIPYLKRQGYGVTLVEKVDAHDRTRQAEERTSVAMRLLRAYRDRRALRFGRKTSRCGPPHPPAEQSWR